MSLLGLRLTKCTMYIHVRHSIYIVYHILTAIALFRLNCIIIKFNVDLRQIQGQTTKLPKIASHSCWIVL